MINKSVLFDVVLKSAERKPRTYITRQQVMTNDKNSVEINFRITDATPTELSGATATVYLYMKDGSFFQKTNNDIARENNVFKYVLKENEAKHKGIAQTQIVVKIGTSETASPLFDFDIVGGLETKPIVEREIQDWTTLTAEAKAFVDQIKDVTVDEFVELKMGEELQNLEANYATRLTGLESNDANLTAQLAEIVTLVPPFFGDSTQSIQEILDNALYEVFLSPDHVYHVSELKIPNNIKINGRNATLKMMDGQPALKSILKMTSVSNINIKNLKIDGTRESNGINTGSQDGGNHGIAIISSSKIKIENVTIQNCGTDGIYVSELSGGSIPSTEITLLDVTSNNNMRQGLSIIHCKNFYAKKCTFTNSNGKLPQAGLDIEPNVDVENIDYLFEDCVFSDNAGRGVVIQNKGTTKNIIFLRGKIERNLAEGVRVTGRGSIEKLEFQALDILENGERFWIGSGEINLKRLKIINVFTDERLLIQKSKGCLIEKVVVNRLSVESASIVLLETPNAIIKNCKLFGGRYGIDTFSNLSNGGHFTDNEIISTDFGFHIKSDENYLSGNKSTSSIPFNIFQALKNIFVGNTSKTLGENSVSINSSSKDNILYHNVLDSPVSNVGGETNKIDENFIPTV